MPNQLDPLGLQIKSMEELIADLQAGFQAVYGDDVNIDPSAPDGQIIGIMSQAFRDRLELLLQVYNSFFVGTAVGIQLDERVALNGLTRQAGTYTTQDVDVTVDRALTLTGLDALVADPTAQVFTVSDDAGNQFLLQTTAVIVGAGTSTLSFRASAIGAVQVLPNTIVNQVTVVLGVTALNNPNPPTTVGQNEETDAQLRLRHAASFRLAATGPADAIEAALREVDGVTDAFVAENNSSSPANGVPARSVWIIVDGGADADVGQAIYSKKVPGCGMKGAQSVVIARPNGTSFTPLWDRPLSENLYMRMTLVARVPGTSFDTTLLKTQLAAALSYRLNQSASIGDIVFAMQTLAPLAIVTVVGVSSDGMSYVDVLAPSDYQHKFVVDVSRITIST